MNSTTVVGNVTRQPELRYTPSGIPVAKFGVAVSRSYTSQAGERVEQTDFFEVTAWNQLAENICESIGIGTRVVVTGRLQQDRWESDGGEKRSRVYIQVDEVAPSLRWATASVTKTLLAPRESAPGQNDAPADEAPATVKRTRKTAKSG
jgi:single-strand DNA-binding protein